MVARVRHRANVVCFDATNAVQRQPCVKQLVRLSVIFGRPLVDLYWSVRGEIIFVSGINRTDRLLSRGKG
jgi:hypothetical protein